MKGFVNELELRFLDDELKGKPFEVEQEFSYITEVPIHPDLLSYQITVPAGYRTDFASVPRFFHRLISPIGKHGKAAVIHDWLCDNHITDHKTSAKVFLEAMTVLKVSKLRRSAMYRAVLWFGPKFKADKKAMQ